MEHNHAAFASLTEQMVALQPHLVPITIPVTKGIDRIERVVVLARDVQHARTLALDAGRARFGSNVQMFAFTADVVLLPGKAG
jgi:hypothetical protein